MALSSLAIGLAPILLETLINSFDEGGDVKKTQIAKIHSGEFILPKGISPTKAQRKAVAKGKKQKKKKVKKVKKGSKKSNKPDFV